MHLIQVRLNFGEVHSFFKSKFYYLAFSHEPILENL